MTTYYCYGEDGKVTATNLNPNAPAFTRGLQGTTSDQQHGDIVGAYLAHRAMVYPAPNPGETNQYGSTPYQPWGQPLENSTTSEPMEPSHWSSDEYESSSYPTSSQAESISTLGYAGWASHSGIAHPYPNPEDIRHMHTLHSLLPYLQPERKLNALHGPAVDIIEQDTGVVLAYQVPKKLLVLFLGRRVVNKYIRTVQRQDGKSSSEQPTYQEMNLPRGKSSKAAMRVLIAWMARACQYHTMATMEQIRIPKKTFVACSLAQTMELLGLHKDAFRVNNFIAQTHFVRPIFAVELEALWNCLGEENRYVYAAIRVVGNRLQTHENNDSKAVPGIDADMYATLKRYPQLEARVRDPELNERYHPHFSTNWTKRLGGSEHNKRMGSSPGSHETVRDYCPTEDDHKSQIRDVEDVANSLESLNIVPVDSKSLAAHAESDVMPHDGSEPTQW
ncbi:hypothetical protein COCC4DRAFT_192868 [Bipolaris maydis ATCC 48331]|uniref:Uncharacterized protein n=3 Tax=Cochliobolus heterostrophus TaxID=5016 RepID=M2TM14_COCH5|nr:uncharacterized protein COCC4DRAFT_192868 [Bipolaris maydis ATCC 48331]EMD87569.1 hypothetical protein COCHEDRAFT_1184739 [Bipolaris maydis C5]ENI06769.1 hypothetical protein COCC4DRAFT_192868 [Bipolaris maydis ATCC 48331]KAJ6212033.1 hypothetical protein PSV09DRAFT_1184739 [Bipolaris maydis]